MSVTSRPPSKVQEAMRALRNPVYQPQPEDLVRLRELAGMTQKLASRVILGGATRGRWPIWESKSSQATRPSKLASRLILQWAMNYSPATKKWATELVERELRERIRRLQSIGVAIMEEQVEQIKEEGEA